MSSRTELYVTEILNAPGTSWTLEDGVLSVERSLLEGEQPTIVPLYDADLNPIVDSGRALSKTRYSSEEWADLKRQVEESIAADGISFTTSALRGALADRRRIRFGALNGLALIAHIDALQNALREANEIIHADGYDDPEDKLRSLAVIVGHALEGF